MKNILAITLIGFALTACGEAVPVVSDYNGDSVKIQVSTLMENQATNAQKEADRICAKGGKKAEYASTRTVQDYTAEYLYLCL